MSTPITKPPLEPLGHPKNHFVRINDDQRCDCLLLCPGLLFRWVELNDPADVIVDFQCQGAVLEFGCLVSGRLRGTACFGSGQKRHVDAVPGQTWCAFSTNTRGTINYLQGQPVCVVSFLIFDPLIKNLPLLQSGQTNLGIQASGGRAFHAFGRLTPEVRQILHQIDQIRENTNVQNQLMLMSKAYELLFHLSSIARNVPDNLQSEEKYQGVKRAQHILDQDLASPPSLEQLARQSGLCVTHLAEGFKHQFGTTVFGYVRQKRLARAKQLITLHGMNASQAAWEVGYASLSSFIKAFNSHYGVTPGTFSKKALKGRTQGSENLPPSFV